ncbi:MAG: energy transducer TonB [Terracidiphilus sp.]
MIARAEMSTNAQSTQAEQSASKGMSVALIGPNDAHRKIVARALASSQGREVHEFIDYPSNLNDLPAMVEQSFDVVLVDVDTDESYALQIIGKLAEIGQPVMAYSARTDQELLVSCMRAGARDFLPLPTENAPEENRSEQNHPEQSRTVPPAAAPVAKPAAAAAPPVAARPVESRPAQVPVAPTAPAVRSNVKPIAPQNRLDPGAETWFARAQEENKIPAIAHKDPAIAQVIEEITIGSRSQNSGSEMSATEKAPSEFDAWDAANLRPAPPAPTPIKRAENRPRPALVPERRKTEAPARTVPSLDSTPAPAIERPPVAVELFRSSQLHTESEPDEAAEKQGAKWIKWLLIAAGPMVLALVLLVVFTRPSAPNPAAKPVKEATPTPDLNQANLIVNQPVNSSAKPIAGTLVAKPAATAADATASTESAPVSPDAMAEQLVAPTRIAGSIKKPASADAPPPAAPSAVSMDDNGGVPGSLFKSASKAKVAPNVVAISAGVADGMILRKTPPIYPKFAQDAHITGKVVLKATITKQGTLEGVQVLSGPKMLAPAAVDAVKTWKYKPYMLDNQPVSVETNITIVFGMAGK